MDWRMTSIDDVGRLLGLIVGGPWGRCLGGGRSIVSLLWRRLVAGLGLVDRPGWSIGRLGWRIGWLLSSWRLVGWLSGGWWRLVCWLGGWGRFVDRLLGGRGLVDGGLGGGGVHRLGRGNRNRCRWGRGRDVDSVVAVALVLLLGRLGV